jgi:sperm-associated antigen 16 protein
MKGKSVKMESQTPARSRVACTVGIVCSITESVGDESEDLNTAMQRLLDADATPAAQDEVPQPTIEKHPEVVDDFIRNFFIKVGMHRTLDSFETEW